MKGKLLIGVVVILIFVLSLSYYAISLSGKQIDTSWIPKVEQLAQTYQPYPNGTYYSNPDVTLSYLNMFITENGTEQLIYFGNGDILSTYLAGLLNNATIKKGVVNETYLDQVLASDKVVTLNYRLSILTEYNRDAKYYSAFFTLKDNLGTGLEGIIIARDIHSSNLDLLAVSK